MPLQELSRAVIDIGKGNFNRKVQVHSNDEIGELARVFNIMVGQLSEFKADMEQKITERTAKVEKLNQFMVGRELKMFELKRELLKTKQTKVNEGVKQS